MEVVDRVQPVCPVIALVGSQHEMKQQAFALGANDYITCPPIAEEMLVRLKLANTLTPKVSVASYPDVDSWISKVPQVQAPLGGASVTNRECELVRKTCRYLTDNMAQNHLMSGLARTMATNRNTLALSFKHVLGRGVFSWLREQRMRKAGQLLATTRMSIQQICFEVGYRDPANFSTAFKAIYKQPPRKYRSCMLKAAQLD